MRRLLYFIRSLHYYKFTLFRKADTQLVKAYLLNNPYTIAKNYLLKKGESEVYTYGETPLPTLDKIVKIADLSSHDTIYELGCGRGRAAFWLALILKAKVVAIDYVPDYIAIAKKISDRLHLNNPTFLCKDFLNIDLSSATALYLNGTCLSEEQILKLVAKLKSLKQGTKLITTSFSMRDYGGLEWKLEKELELPFSWGTAAVYFQVKRQ